MLSSFPAILQRLLCATLLACVAVAAQAQTDKPDPNSSPEQLVFKVANQALDALKAGGSTQESDIARINKVVDQYVLPHVDFEKTTRLAAGRYWRQATPQQRTDLAQAFRGTLIRTYSGALTRVDPSTTIKLLPKRSNDVQGDDAVVRTTITANTNAQPVEVDYRLSKGPQGWQIYDLNVEAVWLIQNYRNQFAQQIEQSGIDGLIKALNQRNSGN
ncbi:phospholipid-binding protein MlaC [Bordetella sp. FB-8]|uniref:MlaC/ttg2D family ABC transporter substrate-binding protein n=1 Tax=Bordetella sp. FB-8 TaxID=1159870 RepID=UPI00036F71E7|nr:ABC transporter substrate-binding protein [Bordetella sp. FB-8]